jgi:hypothetical protein
MAVACQQDELFKMTRNISGCAREQTLRAAFDSLLDGVTSTLEDRARELSQGNSPLKTVTGLEMCVSSGRGAKGAGQDQATFLAEAAHEAVMHEDDIAGRILAQLSTMHLGDDDGEYAGLWAEVRDVTTLPLASSAGAHLTCFLLQSCFMPSPQCPLFVSV